MKTTQLARLAGLATLIAAGAAACGSRDTAADTAAAATTPAPAAATTPDSTAAAATAAAPGALLDPNTATREQIAALPGMDAALADSLVAKRPFADMLAVDRVLAAKLSETQRDTIYARMFRPLHLNKASAQEIELIPGVGGRMRHEFEEYRPYTNIEQFRREIGKYVNQDEVARLEKYVRIE